MSNIIRLLVDNPDELRDAGAYDTGALIRTQWSATETGAFVDISGTGSDPTVNIASGVFSYLAYDPNGTTTTWYRTRYENAAGTRVSEWSAAFLVGASAGLCSLQQVKLRIFPAGVTDTADDDLITFMIDQLTDWISHYTHRKLVPVNSTTYTFDTVAGHVLRVPLGIRSVTTLEVNNLAHQPDTGGSYTTVTAADYLLRPKSQDSDEGWPYTELWLSRGTLTGTIGRFGNIQNGARITGTFGFAVTPPDIAAVAMDAVIAAYQARKLGTSGVIGADQGALIPWADFFGFGSPQHATLERYRYQGMA